jgi:penicillin-binding protein 1B
MSFMLESRFSKDEILETYINIIYMGQNGSFQVRGYGAASEYYFGKDVSQLNLGECALMAAVINSPGIYNPFKRPENATKRRNLVVDKMLELKFITDGEAQEAKAEALPKSTPALATETAPYYIDAVRKQMDLLKIPVAGAKIYTGLDLEAQDVAQEALQNHLDALEKNSKTVKALKAKGHSLEGMVLSGNPRSGLISVAVGGRNFRMTQFNRAVDGHRQVGSTMKPFVYLTALENQDKQGQDYTPITLLNDTKFTIKYEGQSWSPENYGKKYFGQVPMFYALKNSLNAATASMGLEVGLDKIIDTARLLGIQSDLKPLPSLTLGAFELYPREVLQAYMAFSQMGQRVITSFIRRVTDLNGKELFVHDPAPIPTIDPRSVASLVSMMKQTVISGSARAIPLGGFTHPAAGKTGTTNDYKDAWFSGFTPYMTTIVWVGYDKNLTHNLSGSSGAVPIWLQFMKKIATRYPPDDFKWPENTEVRRLDENTLKSLNALQESYDPKEVELVFKK